MTTQPNVTIYTAMLCGYCHRAKRLLDGKGITYTEHDVTFDSDLRRQMAERANGIRTVPQIFIGDRHVGGSDELAALERSGQLDALLSSTADDSA